MFRENRHFPNTESRLVFEIVWDNIYSKGNPQRAADTPSLMADCVQQCYHELVHEDQYGEAVNLSHTVRYILEAFEAKIDWYAVALADFMTSSPSSPE